MWISSSNTVQLLRIDTVDFCLARLFCLCSLFTVTERRPSDLFFDEFGIRRWYSQPSYSASHRRCGLRLCTVTVSHIRTRLGNALAPVFWARADLYTKEKFENRMTSCSIYSPVEQRRIVRPIVLCVVFRSLLACSIYRCRYIIWYGSVVSEEEHDTSSN